MIIMFKSRYSVMLNGLKSNTIAQGNRYYIRSDYLFEISFSGEEGWQITATHTSRLGWCGFY